MRLERPTHAPSGGVPERLHCLRHLAACGGTAKKDFNGYVRLEIRNLPYGSMAEGESKEVQIAVRKRLEKEIEDARGDEEKIQSIADMHQRIVEEEKQAVCQPRAATELQQKEARYWAEVKGHEDQESVRPAQKKMPKQRWSLRRRNFSLAKMS